MYRFKTSFSREKNVLLSRIKERNESLYGFLDRASHLSQTSMPTPSTRSNKVISSFIEFQVKARCLYTYFQCHWACSCSYAGRHPYGITVQDSDLKVLFLDSNNGRIMIKVEVETIERPQRPSLTPHSSKSEEVLTLGRQISFKNRLNIIKGQGDKSIFTLAASAFSTFSAPAIGEGKYDDLERPQQKLKKKYVLIHAIFSERRKMDLSWNSALTR